MNKLAWIVPLALLASAPAFSWCIDHDADDAKYCKEHPRPKCDGDADDKHVGACKSDSGGTHVAHGVPEPDSLPLMLLVIGSSFVFIRRRRKWSIARAHTSAPSDRQDNARVASDAA